MVTPEGMGPRRNVHFGDDVGLLGECFLDECLVAELILWYDYAVPRRRFGDTCSDRDGDCVSDLNLEAGVCLKRTFDYFPSI